MQPNPSGTLAPVTAKTIGDETYERLRDHILRGNLLPGSFIREQEVSAALGVSRTPVRIALARLASEGFVERIPHRGYRIPPGAIEEIVELYPIITALEVLAGRLSFPHLDAEDMVRLREVNERFANAVERNDRRKAIEDNDEFHHLLSSRCGNRTLCSMLDELRTRVARLEIWSADHPAHIAEAYEQHEAILRAIEDEEYDTALDLLERNRLQTFTAFRTEVLVRGASGGE